MAINELGRVVIQVPGVEASMGLGHKYVAVAIDDGDGGGQAQSITRGPEYAYSVIGRVCDGRAVETVGGGLVVAGKQVTPEVYLKLWREALAQAVGPEQAEQEFGVKVTLVVRGNAIKQAGMPRQWTTDPMDGFDAWAQKYAHVMKPDADGYFEFQMGVSEPEAYLTWGTMTSYCRHEDEDPRNSRTMRVELTKRPEAAAKSVIREDIEQGSLFV